MSNDKLKKDMEDVSLDAAEAMIITKDVVSNYIPRIAADATRGIVPQVFVAVFQELREVRKKNTNKE